MYLYGLEWPTRPVRHQPWAVKRRYAMVSSVPKLLLLLPLIACSSTLAQTSTGTIIGQVKDSSGAVVASANVKLTLVANGTTRNTKTNDSGDFNAPVIPPGEYAITVSAQGFADKTLTGITLLVDQTLNLTISMQVGAVGQSIEVEAAAPLVDSVTSSLGQVVEEKQILNMPLNGRNPYTLGLLVGNTTPLFGVQSNLPFIAGGGRFTAVDVSLDGVDNNTVTNLGNIGRTGIAISLLWTPCRNSKSRQITSRPSSGTLPVPSSIPRSRTAPTSSMVSSSNSCVTTS